ncbi:AAA family ATPase, partial [Salinibacter ruber]
MSTSLFDVNYDLFVRDLSPLLKSYARSVPDELDSEPASLHRLEPLFSPIEISDEGSNGERRRPEPEPEKEHLASDEPSDEEEESEESGKIDRIKKGDEGVLISAQKLIEADLDPLDFAVPGLFPKGVSLLAGPPKSGKSLLALNLSLAVARGGKALGEIPVQQGNALVMSLEDGARRTGERLRKMGAEHEEHDESAILEARERLNLTFHWKKFGPNTDDEQKEGKSLLQLVLGALQKIGEDYRLIVVDTLQRLRRQANVGANIYVEDYKAMKDFQEIARELDAAVLLLHHTNKLRDAEDPYLRVSGSTGLTAQADTVAVLEGDRIESEARLQVSGRDISGHDLGLRLDTDTLNWQLVGSGHALGMGDVRKTIYTVLKEADGPLSPSEVDNRTEVEYGRVKTELGRMVDAKQISKVGRGEYTV